MTSTERPPPNYFQEGMPGYVLRDWEVIDYACYMLPDTGLWFRGPKPKVLRSDRYFSAIGAAQTFGCFCPEPYPTLLSKQLGLPALNLGYSGAGPAFFLRHPELIAYVNAGAFCLVQVMSARSTSNDLLNNPEGLAYGVRRSDGEPVTAEAIFDAAISNELARFPLPLAVTRRLLRFSRLPLPAVRRLMQQSRENWLRDFKALLAAITVPKILVWISERRPAYIPSYHGQSALMGKFPQFVDDRLVAAMTQHIDRYVESVSARGMPQPLYSRFTGAPVTLDLNDDRKPLGDGSGRSKSLYSGLWKTNPYYPSPEMHADAAQVLAPVCREFWDG